MKLRFVVLLAVLVSILWAVPAYSQAERIRGVSLDIRSDIEPGAKIGDTDIDIQGPLLPSEHKSTKSN